MSIDPKESEFDVASRGFSDGALGGPRTHKFKQCTGMKGIKVISMGVPIDATRNYYLFRKEYNDNHHTFLLVNEDLLYAGSAFVTKFLVRTPASRLLKLIDKAIDKEGKRKIE